MNSHTYQALTGRVHPALRSVVMVLVLFSSLLVQSTSAPDAVRADGNVPPAPAGLTANFSTLPLSFVPNVGQLDPHFQYHVHGMGTELLFAPDEVMLIVPSAAEGDATQTVRLSFVGANQNPVISTTGTLPGIINYLYGNDPDQWLTNIPTYDGLMYELLYPGISLHYDGSQGMLEGTYLVQPGANPDLIRWQYDGVARVQLDPATQDLRLVLSDAADSTYLTELAPLAWQEIGGARVPVDVGYTILDDQTIRFVLGSYDPSLNLYIDPSIQYSTYLGGAFTDEGYGIAVDDSANAYLTGRTDSDNLPTEAALQGSRAGDWDAFVTKISMSTSSLVFSTYLGGAGYDEGQDIAVDASGNVYVTGETRSPSFPTTTGVYQAAYRGNSDAFVTKLNATGSALVFSTFLGGTESDKGHSLAVDASGNVFIAGDTSSVLTFPIVNAISGHSTYGGGSSDGFVTKLNADATNVLFSTFLGGADVDRAQGIIVDSSYVYVTGRTDSATGFSGSNAGGGDAFIAKFSSSGTPTVIYATYLGGSGLDEAKAIAIDGSGKAYVTGVTGSSDFPRVSALPDTLGGTDKGGNDAFVTAFSSSGTRFFSTYLGGSLDDSGLGIGLDNGGDIYVAGQTQSADFPYVNGFQPGGVLNGLSDAFVTKIVASAPATLDYSSFVGGGSADQANALAVSGGGSAYITGATSSTDFPTTPNTFERGGSYDAFLTRIGSTSADVAIQKLDDIDPVAIGQNLPYTITVRNLGPDPTTVSMTDTLSTYVAFISATPTKGTCDYNSSTRIVSCQFGEMVAGEVQTVALLVNVTTRPVTGAIFNKAIATGTEYDPSTPNAWSQYTQIYAQADLEVIKLSDAYRVRQDSDVNFTISIHNLGPGLASNVDLTDFFPDELTYISADAPPGTTYTVDPITGDGLWTVGTIQANATTTLTIHAHVGDVDDPPTWMPPIGTLITNTAGDLNLDETDPVSDNDSSTIQLRVVTDFPENGCHPSPTNPNEVICLTR